MEIEMNWVEPPPSLRSPTESYMALFVAELRKQPGRWALYNKAVANPATSAQRLKKRYGVEAVTRKVDGEVLLFARHVDGKV